MNRFIRLGLLLVLPLFGTPVVRAFVVNPLNVGVGYAAYVGSGTGTASFSISDDNSGASPAINSAGPAVVRANAADLPFLSARPRKKYSFSVTTGSNSSTLEYSIVFDAPAGYQVYIDGTATGTLHLTPPAATGPTYHSYEIRPIGADGGSSPGAFSGISMGKAISWNISLGSLRSGRSAGFLAFRESDPTTMPFASRNALYYTVPNNQSQIDAVVDSGTPHLRQIRSAAVFIDLVDNAGGGYTIKCYDPSLFPLGNGSVYTIPSGATPWKTVTVSAPDANTPLQIVETEGSVSQTSTLVRSGTYGSSAYTWTLTEGGGLKTATVTSSLPGGGGRDEVYVVQNNASPAVVSSKTKIHYTDYGWGQEVTAMTADPDGAALTTVYDYYTDPASTGHYRQLKSVIQPNGKWEAYVYYDGVERLGNLNYIFRPWLDGPTTPYTTRPDSPNNPMPAGIYVAYLDSAPDWTGQRTIPVFRQEWIDSKSVGYYTGTANDNGGDPWMPYRVVDLTHYAQDGGSITTTTKTYRPDLYDWAGLPFSSRAADNTKTSYQHRYGNYVASTNTFTVDTSLAYWRDIAWHGTSDANAGGTLLNTYNNATVDDIYLIPNKSTMDVTIRTDRGLPIHTEQLVYTGGTSFARLTYTDYTYDVAGRLLQSVDNNGATVTNTYINGRLVSTIDASGTETQSTTFDALGRVLTVVKKGAPSVAAALTGGYNYPAQGDITTTYTYDASSHVTQQVASGGSLSQTSTSAFDLAGRQTQSVQYAGSANVLTTGYSYSSGGRIVTTTLPGGATRTTENYLDGQLKQVYGSAVVSEYYNYAIDSTTSKRLQQRIVGGGSAAWTNTYSDALGRPSSEWIPGWDGNATSRTWTYNTLGQLTKTTAPGANPTLYSYDALGACYRQGLDVNNNGTLDLGGSDRVTETAYSLFLDGSNRATKQTSSKVYGTAGSSTATTVSTSTTLLSGLGTNVLSSASSTDIFGNVTTSTVTVDRANKLVTSTTDAPDSTVDAVSVAYNGLGVEARTTASQINRSEYDALGRKIRDIDPRTGTSVTAFITGTSLVSTITDAALNTVVTYGYDAAGRVATLTNADGKVARYDYTSRGEKLHEWGDTPYPVEYGYDNSGRQTSMKTYRGGTGWTGTAWPTATAGTADATSWVFDDGTHSGDHATGLLRQKTDAANKSVTYSYTPARQLYTRTWARNVSATYGYDPATGEQTGIDYSDSTPDLTYTYGRMGQISTVTDVTGTRTYHYSATTFVTEDETLPGFYSGRVLTWKHDPSTAGALGRNTGFSLGLSNAPTGENDIAYGYDTYGRFNTLGANLGGAASGNFTYAYTSNSNLMGSLTETGSGLLQSRGYETHRDLYQSVDTTLPGSPTRHLATYAYTNDVLGRRTVKVETGEMYQRYGPGLVTTYGYNPRSEVTSSQTYLGTDPVAAPTVAGNTLQGRSFYYSYDPIGNRTATTTNGQSSTYTTNSLNQIVDRTTPGATDVSGFAASNATVTVAGQPTTRQFDFFYRQHAINNTSGPIWATLPITATVPGGATASETRYAYLAKSLEHFDYDLDGNLLSDGRWDYSWDAENRLVSMSTTTAAIAAGIPQQSLVFRYDYLGRRVEKLVYTGSGVTLTADTKFIYSSTNWHLLAEYNALSGNALIRSYSWGIDLSGSTGGAGGVGGLLAIRDAGTAAAYLPVYDANGNVFSLVDKSTAAVVASYEYDAFGNTLRASGSSSFAAVNPFRFSTKYTDSETQLVYYGYRYYSPSQGRFLGRDPVEEKGGLHLYAFCANNGTNHWDLLGQIVGQGAHDSPTDPDLRGIGTFEGDQFAASRQESDLEKLFNIFAPSEYSTAADGSLYFDYGRVTYGNGTFFDPGSATSRGWSSIDLMLMNLQVDQAIEASQLAAYYDKLFRSKIPAYTMKLRDTNGKWNSLALASGDSWWELRLPNSGTAGQGATSSSTVPGFWQQIGTKNCNLASARILISLVLDDTSAPSEADLALKVAARLGISSAAVNAGLSPEQVTNGLLPVLLDDYGIDLSGRGFDMDIARQGKNAAKLNAFLDSGEPMMAAVFRDKGESRGGHTVVFMGIGDGQVLYTDPFTGDSEIISYANARQLFLGDRLANPIIFINRKTPTPAYRGKY